MQIRKVKFVLKIYLASLENWYIMYINKFYLFILVEHIYQDEFNYVLLECTVYFEVKGNTFVKKSKRRVFHKLSAVEVIWHTKDCF